MAYLGEYEDSQDGLGLAPLILPAIGIATSILGKVAGGLFGGKKGPSGAERAQAFRAEEARIAAEEKKINDQMMTNTAMDLLEKIDVNPYAGYKKGWLVNLGKGWSDTQTFASKLKWNKTEKIQKNFNKKMEAFQEFINNANSQKYLTPQKRLLLINALRGMANLPPVAAGDPAGITTTTTTTPPTLPGPGGITTPTITTPTITPQPVTAGFEGMLPILLIGGVGLTLILKKKKRRSR